MIFLAPPSSIPRTTAHPANRGEWSSIPTIVPAASSAPIRGVYPAASAQRSVVSRRLTLSVMSAIRAQKLADGAALIRGFDGEAYLGWGDLVKPVEIFRQILSGWQKPCYTTGFAEKEAACPRQPASQSPPDP
jgi:hypothetical protein